MSDRDLTGPERVRIATTAYAETEDLTGRFSDECCRLGPDLRAEYTALCAAYKAELVGPASPKEMQDTPMHQTHDHGLRADPPEAAITSMDCENADQVRAAFDTRP